MDRQQFFTKERLYNIFKHFDVDDSGFITEDNLKEAMARGGRKLPEEKIKIMIKEGDYDKNNVVSFKEFKNLMEDDYN